MTKYILLGSVIVIAMLSLALWFLYGENEQLNKDIATEKANVVRLADEINEQNDTILLLDKQREVDQAASESISGELQAARKEVKDLKSTFSRHNLNSLSMKKPGLIEKIINRGTRKVFKELEELTK